MDANVHHLLTLEFHSLTNFIPFYQLDVDIVGSFLKIVGGKEFLIVGIDHFTKWIEVKALVFITACRVKDFFWNDIIIRFKNVNY